MNTRFLEFLLPFLLFKVILLTSACPPPPFLKFNCDQSCTEFLNSVVGRFVNYSETAEDLQIQLKNESIICEDLRIQLNITNEELKTKEDLVKSMNETIQNLESRLAKETDQLRIINGTDGCTFEGPGGIYKAKLNGLEDFEVPCLKNGWMTIQRRSDGSENFDRSWEDYKEGFGKVTREFFIGLEKLHLMTKSRPHELYIRFRMADGVTSHAHYDNFEIGNETESFVLKSLGKYSGTAGDSLSHQLNQKFTTFDKDNDEATYNCAGNECGGWWYKSCAESTLNGKYYRSGFVQTTHRNGIYWTSFTSWNYIMSLTSVEMMIRPKIY